MGGRLDDIIGMVMLSEWITYRRFSVRAVQLSQVPSYPAQPALQEIVPRFLPSESTSTVPTRSLTKLKRARTERKGQASIYLHSLSCCFACCLALLCIYRSRPAIHSTIHKDGQSLSCVHHLINNSVGLFQ